MNEVRVFPRRNAATPMDENVYIGYPDLFVQADKALISVAFTWDIPEAEKLFKAWSDRMPTEMGGPAFNQPGGEFEPGKFLKKGMVITSRGCPNHCWFCSVPKREPGLKELKIKDGWNVCDDNLLACSEEHIRKVFAMLKRQNHSARFTGGLEAARLQEWHVELLKDLNPDTIFFAYDTPDDYEPLVEAGKKLDKTGFLRPKSRHCMAYVLIGYPKDTIIQAEDRLIKTYKAGFMPFAMLWKDKDGKSDPTWRDFQRIWARPSIVGARIDNILEGYESEVIA